VLAGRGSNPGEVDGASALAADPAGNLYVAEFVNRRLQRRDPQGNWSVLATVGSAPGQLLSPNTLAVDTVGNLYVAEANRIQKRDTQGDWSVLAPDGSALGQVEGVTGLAVDSAGNLYVAEIDNNRLRRRDSQGNWSVVATYGYSLGQVIEVTGLAVDTADTLYVADLGGADSCPFRIQKRSAQGRWSVIAPEGEDIALCQVYYPSALAADSAGSLYLAEAHSVESGEYSRLQRRDAKGNWLVIATDGPELGQVFVPFSLAVDTGGNLYIADNGSVGGRIQKRDSQGHWSVIATELAGALAVDPAGNLYMADTDNNRVLKYTSAP
jgi:DNA-binding beta-propeller fold protein YncE